MLARIGVILGTGALAGLFSGTSRWRLILWAGPVLALAVVFLTASRGAMFGLFPAAIIMAVLVLRNRGNRLAISIAVIGVIATALVLDQVMGHWLLARFALIGERIGDMIFAGVSKEGSVNQRLQMYAAGWQAFANAPLLGYGWSDFAPAAGSVMDMRYFGGPENRWFQFHNDFLNMAVAAGIPGVLCWVALHVAPIAGALATPRDEWFRLRLGAMIALSVMFLLFGLTDMGFGYDLPTTLYAFIATIILASWRSDSVTS
jgi:O-antigen ligase